MQLSCKPLTNGDLWVPGLHLPHYSIASPGSTHCKGSVGIIKYPPIGIWGLLVTTDTEWNVVQILWERPKDRDL